MIPAPFFLVVNNFGFKHRCAQETEREKQPRRCHIEGNGGGERGHDQGNSAKPAKNLSVVPLTKHIT